MLPSLSSHRSSFVVVNLVLITFIVALVVVAATWRQPCDSEIGSTFLVATWICPSPCVLPPPRCSFARISCGLQWPPPTGSRRQHANCKVPVHSSTQSMGSRAVGSPPPRATRHVRRNAAPAPVAWRGSLIRTRGWVASIAGLVASLAVVAPSLAGMGARRCQSIPSLRRLRLRDHYQRPPLLSC